MAASTDPKYFNSFRTDLYKQHLHGQHPVKWEFTALSTNPHKQQFSNSPEVSYAETLEAVFKSEDTLQFTLSLAIVDVIIGRLLFARKSDLRDSAFVFVFSGQHERPLQHHGVEDINKIGQEFKSLNREYDSNKSLCAAIDGFDHRLASFRAMWGLSEAFSRFPTLASFCRGIATVFPNTATVDALRHPALQAVAACNYSRGLLTSTDTLAVPTARFNIDSDAAQAIQTDITVDKRLLRGLEMPKDASDEEKG
ncbi:hypothetical protein ON010_g1943 [Phytophthora cinnamomi]|nr:hypothetical protein ON010_g1943 [Phytophthora cinnamomi]